MFKGAAVKVFQHTHLPFYVILCNCEVNWIHRVSRVEGFESFWLLFTAY